MGASEPPEASIDSLDPRDTRGRATRCSGRRVADLQSVLGSILPRRTDRPVAPHGEPSSIILRERVGRRVGHGMEPDRGKVTDHSQHVQPAQSSSWRFDPRFSRIPGSHISLLSYFGCRLLRMHQLVSGSGPLPLTSECGGGIWRECGFQSFPDGDAGSPQDFEEPPLHSMSQCLAFDRSTNHTSEHPTRAPGREAASAWVPALLARLGAWSDARWCDARWSGRRRREILTKKRKG